MRYDIYAIGGNKYPIDHMLPDRIRHYAAPMVLIRPMFIRWMAATIRRPSVLIGFSAGANMALEIAGRSRMVEFVFAHSPENKQPPVSRDTFYHVYRTRGDRTPTFAGAAGVREWIASQTAAVAPLLTLDMDPFPHEPSPLEMRVLWPLRHIFHNVLPILRQHPATSEAWRS